MKSKLLAIGLVLCLGTARADDTPRAAIGEAAPAFCLRDLDGQSHTLEQHTREGRIVVLEWFHPACPFVRKHHVTFDTLRQLRDAHGDKVAWFAIDSSSREARAEEAFLAERRRAKEALGLAYPLLLDPTGQVGRACGATHASQVFVVDAKGVLVYSGAIDDDPSAEGRGSTNHLEAALDAALDGKPVETPTTRPYGCPIEYAPPAPREEPPADDEPTPEGAAPDEPGGAAPDEGETGPEGKGEEPPPGSQGGESEGPMPDGAPAGEPAPDDPAPGGDQPETPG